MIVIESRVALHLLAPGVSGDGFKVHRERKEFDSIPHWVRPRLQNFIDAGLLTYEEVLPPAEKKADTTPAPPPDEETAAEDTTDAPSEAKRKRR